MTAHRRAWRYILRISEWATCSLYLERLIASPMACKRQEFTCALVSRVMYLILFGSVEAASRREKSGAHLLKMESLDFRRCKD
jgi:hypothetical protein